MMDREMGALGPEVPPNPPPEWHSLEESRQADKGKDRFIDGVSPTPSIHPNGHESPTASDADPISRKPLRQTYAKDVTQVDRVANRLPVRQGESLRAISPPLDAKKLQSQLAESEENTRRVLEQLEKEEQENKYLREANQEQSGSYKATISSLTLELEKTKADLEDTRSHILSMQPYVKDTTPEEITRVLYGSVPECTNMLQQIEDSMRESVQPKRDLFAVRNWRAESYTSLMNHPKFSVHLDERRVEVTKGLGKLFLPLIPQTIKPNVFYDSLDRKIIVPALELQEKMESSIHYYELTLKQYEGPSYGAVSDHDRASKLLAELDEVDCEDVLGNRRRWDPAKLPDPPSQDDMQHKLYPICTLSPRLVMRQVGRGEIVKEPRVLRKQKTLVAWATPAARASRLAEEPPTLMNAIYNMRQPRSNGVGGFFGYATATTSAFLKRNRG
ncbi:hypothetical protein DL769_011678 [Monosporascus sp. CRB-8-3]|nr:hypothetical protein DL769_011678 [Monosporascus sp. CRB-8-3]